MLSSLEEATFFFMSRFEVAAADAASAAAPAALVDASGCAKDEEEGGWRRLAGTWEGSMLVLPDLSVLGGLKGRVLIRCACRSGFMCASGCMVSRDEASAEQRDERQNPGARAPSRERGLN